MVLTSATPRSVIVAKVREFLGTPFHHQGRLRGVGIDCAGLVVQVAVELGLPCRDHPRVAYSRMPVVGKHLHQKCLEELHARPGVAPIAGNILLFWVVRPSLPQHLGIATGSNSMVHAWGDVGRVVESPLDRDWMRRLVAVFDYQGVL